MNTQPKIPIVRVIIQLLIFVLLIPFLPLLVPWRWDWREAWIYASIYILGFVISRMLAARRHPDLLAERARFMEHENVKSWDKVLAPLLGLGGGLVLLAAGLEARFGPLLIFDVPVKILALAIILAGYFLGSYALVKNRFFSGMVRIQAERGHQVVSSGPYRWVRHPGYAGALLTYLATPFFLDSVFAFLPAAFLAVVLVVRTSLEDRTLQEELAGYRDYSRRVRYRLAPGIW
jgi:protein-S-isoprenylcysteine O-methyltransferase Ste14